MHIDKMVVGKTFSYNLIVLLLACEVLKPAYAGCCNDCGSCSLANVAGQGVGTAVGAELGAKLGEILGLILGNGLGVGLGEFLGALTGAEIGGLTGTSVCASGVSCPVKRVHKVCCGGCGTCGKGPCACKSR